MNLAQTNGHDANILVVDDTPENLRLLARALSGAGYRVRAAPGGDVALRMARTDPPDLILLDVDMPGMSGYEFCEQVHADASLRPVPVLFISALHDASAKLRAFRAGGRDFVTKPFNMDEVLARVATHVELRRLELALGQSHARLERMVAEQVREISDAQLATIVALAKLSESRDDNTGMHVVRMAELSRVIADLALRTTGSTVPYDRSFVRVLGRAATLHDIGKVGIPDAILLKPGKLTAEEFATMKTHAALGSKTLEAVLTSYPGNELVRVGADVARSHHERWDGAGYPDGLAGEAIPVSARIASVADVYDAIRAKRPYKPGQSHEVATEAIRQGSGTQFDPTFVKAFLAGARDLGDIWDAMQSDEEAQA